ncbi:hypothetical protein N0V90_010294 [Kalmusia sp. IMI 367209]|nr:hypothetical protein N0V90_010294 [Kalmusia sp. IMI 367209]
MDEQWRWIHEKDNYRNCYQDSYWNTTLCPDGATCAENCAIDGATYKRVYGVTTSGSNLNLSWVTKFDFSQSVASRVFVLDEGSDDRYKMWKLLNREIAFDVDVSQLPCGLSGSLYLVGMDEDGGLARNLRFVSGEANVEEWVPNPINAIFPGTGKYGSCCPEIDIWEANSISNALTAHPCSVENQTGCSGTSCTSICDNNGCDFNSYRLGNTSFYGPNKIIDTAKKFTVITQFLTHDNTDTGTLIAIRRKYIQNGALISNSMSAIPSISPSSDITESFCRQQKIAFGERDTFNENGGMDSVSKAMGRGMVLVFTITEDQDRQMLWLDSSYPLSASPTTPGVARGSCATDSGHPQDLLWGQPKALASFGDVRVGFIGAVEEDLEGVN